MPKPILRTDVLDMKDLKEGMILKGTVRNVIDFGVFVDIGVHQDGLVHISQITDRFIKHPLEAVSVGDVVDVKVMSVDLQKKRIQLTMRGIQYYMFGYVTANEPELKVKDYHKYKAYYCGLCQSLKRQYGSAGQLTLAYDMTFVIILLTSLYESETKAESHRCKMHPLKPQPMLENEITEYAADMNLIMAYYHLEDDWKDEKKVAGLLGSMALKRKVEKAIRKYPRQSRVIREEMAKLSEYESQGIQEVDYPAGCFGRLMEEMMVYKEDCWEQQLRGIGFYLGKYIYIMDAYEDLDKDLEKGTYNPLKKMHEEAGYEERCRDILCMMIGECARNFEILPCVLDVDILRNILYDGVWKHYRKIQEKKSEEKEDDKESL